MAAAAPHTSLPASSLTVALLPCAVCVYQVRKGVWRGTTVACKRLHALTGAFEISDEDRVAVKAAFLKEMEVLTHLRHPNLLQLLGVTFDERTRSVEWIVTEIMECSLYSVLHEHACELTFSEIIDVSLGVSRGLWVRALQPAGESLAHGPHPSLPAVVVPSRPPAFHHPP